MFSSQNKILNSFIKGTLRIQSVSPDGAIEWKQVLAVHRAEVGGESIWEASTDEGSFILTGGHRVFISPTEKVEMEKLIPDTNVLTISDNDVLRYSSIRSTRQLENRKYMYDLTADTWHNFKLCGSNVVISNSPDRNYHFRPPTGEGEIGCNSQVFGYIWTDEELLAYLQMALDKWNMHPPETAELCTLNALCQKKPDWKAAILWGAVVHAALALAFNWVSEEFSVVESTLLQVTLPDGRVVSLPIQTLHDIVSV